MGEIMRIDADADVGRVHDLMERAADYIRLETGGQDIAAYVFDMLHDAPPGAEICNYGLVRGDGTLAGFMGSVRGYPGPDDWYVGLLVLDPAERRQGLGTWAFSALREIARASGSPVMRIAVLDVNEAGRRFWEARGFEPERQVPGDPDGDGHHRTVMKLELDT